MNWKGVWLFVGLAAAAFAAVVVIAGGSSSNKESKLTSRVATRARKTQGPEPTGEPDRKKVPGPHDQKVPILMYHVISDPPTNAPYTALYVSTSEFKSQVEALAAAGYEGVTPDQVFDYWDEGYPLPKKPVVMTFDDGYESQYKNALPVMKSHDWPGVLFLEVKNLEPSWGLSKTQVNDMIAAGWMVGSHTVTHPDVSALDRAALDQEVGGSRDQLQAMFKQPVDFFCYPAGRYDDEAIAAIKHAGYKGAVTTKSGLAGPGQPYTMPRIRINRGRSGASVVDELESL